MGNFLLILFFQELHLFFGFIGSWPSLSSTPRSDKPPGMTNTYYGKYAKPLDQISYFRLRENIATLPSYT
jgi:hypothetical protein